MQISFPHSIKDSQILSLVVLSLSVVIFLFGVKEIIAIIPLLVLLMGYKKTELFGSLCCIVFGCIMVLLIINHIVQFPMFPQAMELYTRNESMSYWIMSGHPHAIRLLIIYPGVLISKLFQLELDMGVTVYSAALLLLIMYSMIRILILNQLNNQFGCIASGLITIVLAIVMNGRLIFVFGGISLLVLAELEFRNNEMSLLKLQLTTIIAALFTMVSSGTMIVAFAYIIMIIPYRWNNMSTSNERKLFIVILLAMIVPVMSIIVPYSIKMTKKNIDYYGGGMQGAINMIHHGLGRFIDTNNHPLVIGLCFVGIIILLANIVVFKLLARRRYIDLPLILLANLGVYGSVFGLSTGLTAFIPIVILCVESINRTFEFRFRMA